MYTPASSAVHGMYDSLDLFYLNRCMNPFHCFHRVPYYWSKSAVTTYAVFNSLKMADLIFEDVLSHLDQALPEKMPGDLYISEILDKDELANFQKKEQD